MERAGLRELIGRELSSVEFVRDYVQLRFDGPCLSAYTLPAVHKSGDVLSRSSVGYLEALIGCIGKSVEGADAREREQILLRFSDGVSIAISLRPEDYRGAEAATLTTSGNEMWSW